MNDLCIINKGTARLYLEVNCIYFSKFFVALLCNGLLCFCFYIRFIFFFAGLCRASQSVGSLTTASVIGNRLYDVTECQTTFQEQPVA